ncbi:hypothetical protein AB2L27_09400 [Kineococcus sp. LSe6-4]|uniref:Copper resistance protein D domain-containing protein n=1 Tax=Kineococcus halophytocola TaxID=3234027 RepID=A0ABV4H2F4_9ACTN
MFGPLVLALPLTILLLGGLVVGCVLLVRHVPSRDLTAPVARARRRGTVVAGTALALAVALLVAGLALPPTSLPRTQLVAVAPLAAAALHAGVLLAGELTWPRPAQRLRSARLVVRTVRQDAPRGLVVLFAVAGGLLWAVCVAGTALADDSGRAISVHDAVSSASASPFPGAHYAAPIALASALAVVLTVAVLLQVPRRPAVPAADAATDGTLRRAAAHRALRVTTAALLATTAALVVVGGTAAHRVGGSWSVEVSGRVVEGGTGLSPVLDAVSAGVALAGVPLLLLALAVLLVPARGLPRAAPATVPA